MFEKVLIPTDLSDEADNILDFVGGMKVFGVAEVILVHVVNTGVGHPSWPPAPKLVERIESKLSEKEGRLAAAGLIAYTEFLQGNPATEVLRIAEEKECSLIITGSHGKLPIEELFFGSVSEAVMRRSNIPVLLLRYQMFDKAQMGRSPEERAMRLFRKVLFPSDFAKSSTGAMDELEELKNEEVGEIFALHVVDAKRMETETENLEQLDACYADVDQIAEKLGKGRGAVSALCSVGDPVERILGVADEVGATVIMMGTHGRGMVREWLDGSVSLSVLRQADRPVMIVRPAA